MFGMRHTPMHHGRCTDNKSLKMSETSQNEVM